MIAAWMLYAVAVGGLFGAGALALESSVRAHSRPARWAWVASILLSVAWPVGHLARDARPRPPVPTVASHPVASHRAELPAAVFPLEPVTVDVGPESALRLLDGPILVAWALTSAALLFFFGVLVLRTRRLRKGWRAARVGGEIVLVSEDWGPAVVGALRPEVVLPEWCEDAEETTLRLILDHELEHVRAGDPRLLILAGMLPVLFPWHLAVWWQWARLRAAIEGDCDLRVLHRHPGRTRSYVDLLLEVGRRSSSPRPLAAMLSEPYETLKRRIEIMTMPTPKRPWIKGGALAATAAVFAALACAAPGPTDAKDEKVEVPSMAEAADDAGVAREGRPLPVFTAFSVRPGIENRGTVVAALERAYAAFRDDPGIGGTADVWFYIDGEARARDVRVNRSTGHPDLDAAAIGVADIIDFTPALNRDQERAVWVSLPIAFLPGDDPETGAVERPVARDVEDRIVTEPAHDPPPAGAETGVVRGVVRDAGSGQPLADVQVFAAGTGRGTLSSAEGRFEIDHVPAGDRVVVAHLVGYGEMRTPVAVAPDGSTEVDFDLRQAVISLEPLMVRPERASGGS